MAALEVLIDTAGFLALWDTADQWHESAVQLQNELRGANRRFWSFTDCVSFSLMHELGLQDCLTTDHHFRQAGFKPLLQATG